MVVSLEPYDTGSTSRTMQTCIVIPPHHRINLRTARRARGLDYFARS
jgi:hypothetical protein